MEQQIQEVEEFTPQPFPTFEFKLQPSQKYKCGTLVIALFGPSSLFAQSLLEQNAKPTARLNFQRAKQKSFANFYHNSQNNVNSYLIFNCDFEPMKQVHFAKFLSSNFQFKECIILASQTKGNLQKSNPQSLRYINSFEWKQRLLGTQFNEGISGISADVIGWGQVYGWPVVCFIGIFGEYQLNKEIIQSSFGCLRGRYGMQRETDIANSIKKYNMNKYSNKLYL